MKENKIRSGFAIAPDFSQLIRAVMKRKFMSRGCINALREHGSTEVREGGVLLIYA